MSCPGKDLPQKPSNDTLYYFILLNAISSIPGFYSKYTPITLSKKRKETTKDFLTCSSLKLSRLLLPFSLPGIWPHSLLQGKSLKDFCNFSLPQINFHFLGTPTAFSLCVTLSNLCYQYLWNCLSPFPRFLESKAPSYRLCNTGYMW